MSTSKINTNKKGGGPMNEYKTGKKKIMSSVGTYVKKSTVNTTSLAKKLTQNGWRLYIKDSCPYCHLQIDLFGNDKKFLDIRDCLLEREKDPICSQLYVYPTWVNLKRVDENGDTLILPGSQTLYQLSQALK